MRPYIAGLRVDPEDALEAGVEGVERRAVALQEKVVVAQPLGQVLVVHHRPAGVPHAPRDLLRLVVRARRDGEQVVYPGA